MTSGIRVKLHCGVHHVDSRTKEIILARYMDLLGYACIWADIDDEKTELLTATATAEVRDLLASKDNVCKYIDVYIDDVMSDEDNLRLELALRSMINGIEYGLRHVSQTYVKQ